MEFERVSMAQFEEIYRLVQSGISDRKIARILGCRRTLVASVRCGDVGSDLIRKAKLKDNKMPPPWVASVDWALVEKDIRDGHELKKIWEDSAAAQTSNSNFFKYVKNRFALLMKATVTLREFNAGEHCEVDYAGGKIDWLDKSTGEVNQAHVFVGILCFSQKIFSFAAEDEKKSNWLRSHCRMFEFFQGVPKVLVPDQLKNAVIKSHRYDPDLNPDYVELAKHYGIAIVPARVRRPKDKALVEGAVKLIMRYFRFIYRRHTFTSLAEINRALLVVCERINTKVHTRFKVSRHERFETIEKAALKQLPLEPFSVGSWQTATIHPDCTLSIQSNFYSAPHIHRGKEVRVKISDNAVEIFLDLERIAVHARSRKVGERVIDNVHLPENSRAYREVTPQQILSHARFSHIELHSLIDELFTQDTLGNLRRAQGLVRKAYQTIQTYGRETGGLYVEGAVIQLRRFNRIRVKVFEEYIKAEIKKSLKNQEDRTIVRQPGNPMVRGFGSAAPLEVKTPPINQKPI